MLSLYHSYQKNFWLHCKWAAWKVVMPVILGFIFFYIFFYNVIVCLCNHKNVNKCNLVLSTKNLGTIFNISYKGTNTKSSDLISILKVSIFYSKGWSSGLRTLSWMLILLPGTFKSSCLGCSSPFRVKGLGWEWFLHLIEYALLFLVEMVLFHSGRNPLLHLGSLGRSPFKRKGVGVHL